MIDTVPVPGDENGVGPTGMSAEVGVADGDDAVTPGAAANRPPEMLAEPKEETPEEWMRRFLDENEHLALPPIVRPPSPPPQPWDGPRSQWKVPDHLSMPHPNGGYMAAALMSRMTDDLEEVTGGKRAATYEEVDKYLGHALIAEGLVPFTYTADEAAHWWNAGGYKVLGDAPADRPPTPPKIPAYDWNVDTTIGEERIGGTFVPSSAAFMVDPNDKAPLQPTPDTFDGFSGPGIESSNTDIDHEMRRRASAVKISQKGKNFQGTAKKAVPNGMQTLRNGVKYQDWGGNVGEAQKILERYPMLMKQFAGSSIKIAVVPDDVTQYPIANPGGRPRNWAKGKTYKDLPALYYEADDTIIIASRQVVGQSTEYRLLHELGHALDYMKTSRRGFKESRENEFRAAYSADLPRLRKIDKIHYFDNNTPAGWSETYASSFARMRTDRAQLKKDLPNVYAYWAKKGW